MTGRPCILAGIDLGPDTEKVLAYAACAASASGSRLQLLYVIDYLLTPPAYLSSYIEEEKRREEEEMAAWTSRLGAAGIETGQGTVIGRLHEAFVEALAEFSPDLLIIGHRSHLLRPSSSERLIRSLSVPMLVVRGRAAGGASIGSVRISRILCPVDFSDCSAKAVAAARRYAEMFSSELRLLHVIPSHIMKERLGRHNCGRFEDLLLAEAAKKMAALSRHAEEGEALHGDPCEAIPAVAEELGADLVVMGARGLSYLKGMLVGSTTEAVLKTSPCPVLVVR